MWDFGILMCMNFAWEAAYNNPDIQNNFVKKVWNVLVRISSDINVNKEAVSWCDFFQACHQVHDGMTKIGFTATEDIFGIDIFANEMLCCLVLEIWMSEITQNVEIAGKKAKRAISSKSSSANMQKQEKGESVESAGQQSTVEEMQQRLHQKSTCSLEYLLEHHHEELFRSLLLLRAVITSDQLEPPIITPGTKRNIRTAVATRHWYSTASSFNENFLNEQPENKDSRLRMAPVGLPGRYSVRGDWFLAIAHGSRSWGVAWNAMDNLSTQRANWLRLEQGLGLPTVLPADAPELLTALTLPTTKDNLPIRYKDLLSLGAKDSTRNSKSQILNQAEYGRENFQWLWRSSLLDYDRQARTWREWLCRTLQDWNGSLTLPEKDIFQIYRLLSEKGIEMVRLDNRFQNYLKLYELYEGFGEKCERLRKELENSTNDA